MAQEADHQNRRKVIEMLFKAKPNNIQTLEIFCSNNNKMVKQPYIWWKITQLKWEEALRGLRTSPYFSLCWWISTLVFYSALWHFSIIWMLFVLQLTQVWPYSPKKILVPLNKHSPYFQSLTGSCRKDFKSQLEGTPTGQAWNNLNIKKNDCTWWKYIEYIKIHKPTKNLEITIIY